MGVGTGTEPGLAVLQARRTTMILLSEKRRTLIYYHLIITINIENWRQKAHCRLRRDSLGFLSHLHGICSGMSSLLRQNNSQEIYLWHNFPDNIIRNIQKNLRKVKIHTPLIIFSVAWKMWTWSMRAHPCICTLHTGRKKFNNNVLYNSMILQKFQRKDLDPSGLGKWTYNKADVIKTKAKRILDLRKVKMMKLNT